MRRSRDYTLAEQSMRSQAWAVFGRHCGVLISEAWKHGIELLQLEDTTSAVILCDDTGPACVVHYENHELRAVYARCVVGEFNA